MLDDAKRRKAARTGWPRGRRRRRRAGRGPDAGHDLREELDPHTLLLRRRHAPARRRSDHRRAPRTCSSVAARPVEDTARVLSRMVDAVMIRANRHEMWSGSPRQRRAGDQRPDRPEPPLPDPGRPDDLRGASRPVTGRPSPGSATATMSAPASSTPPASWAFKLEDRLPAATITPTCTTWPAPPERRPGRGHRRPAGGGRGADCVLTDTWVSMGDTDHERASEGVRALPGRRAR